jgi:signal transduction histidine kinase/DNA-binding response OmpR family regulator
MPPSSSLLIATVWLTGLVAGGGGLAVPVSAQGQSVSDLSTGWDVRFAGRPAQDSGPSTADLQDTWADLGAIGYDGTVVFSRSFQVPDGARDWSILLGPVSYGVVEVFIDGVAVAQAGDEPGTIPYPQPLLVGIPPSVLDDGEVRIELSVDRVRWISDQRADVDPVVHAGAEIGPTSQLTILRELTVRRSQMDDLPSLILGLLFVLAGVIHLYLFGGNRERRAFLWFGVGAAAFGVNTFAISAWSATFLPTLGLATRVGDASGHIAVIGLLAFLFAALAQPIDMWTRRYLWSHAALAGFVVVAPLALVGASGGVRMLWLAPALVSGFVALRGGMRDGHPEVRTLFVGVAVLAGAQFGEVLRTVGGVDLPDGLPMFGFTFMLLTMTMALGGRFLRLHAETDRLAVELEARVISRTNDLATAVQAAEEANRTKSQFLANMSHELRTPLNSVIGFSNVLVRRVGKDMEPRDRDFLQRIRASGEHLLAIVNDILDISRIEAGNLEILPEEVDVRHLVSEAVAPHRIEAEGKGITLDVSLPSGEAISVIDPNRLKQVLENLVENAVKFTQTGSVGVRLRAQDGVATAVEVVDTGMGIPEDKLEEIFRPFEQVDSSMSRKYHGTGLGLTLSLALSELMGCTLEAESEIDVGSTFRIGLPVAAARSLLAAGTVQAGASVGGAQGRHVLVIDDDSDARLLLAETLGELGCTVTFARSGQEGLERAGELPPDLITLDLHMPGLDGWETLRRLRDDPQLAEIPVMIVSVSGSQAAGEPGNLLGDVDVLDKPVSFNDLERVVQRHLGPNPGSVLVIDDDAGVRAMMEEMLEGVSAEVRTAGDGLEALEVLKDFTPGLIFLDLIMPRMGGMELLARLRSHPQYAETPIIVVTSKDLSEKEQRVLAENTQAIVGKGGDGDLRNRLKAYFPAE